MSLYVPQHTPTWKQNFARSAAVAANPGLRKGLMGAWQANLGPTGNTIRDVSGYGRHGAINETGTGTTWDVSRYGYVLDFDGTNDRANIVSPALYSIVEELTAIVWAYHTREAPPFTPIVMMGQWQDQPWGIGVGEDLLDVTYTYYREGGSQSFSRTTTDNVLPDQWNAIALTYKNPQIEVWHQGKRIASQNIGGPLITTAGPLMLGGRDGVYSPVQIASACLYDRVLSASEIQQHHQDPYALVRQRAVWFPSAVVAPPTGNRRRRLLIGA